MFHGSAALISVVAKEARIFLVASVWTAFVNVEVCM